MGDCTKFEPKRKNVLIVALFEPGIRKCFGGNGALDFRRIKRIFVNIFKKSSFSPVYVELTSWL